MAEKETKNELKKIIEVIPEEKSESDETNAPSEEIEAELSYAEKRILRDKKELKEKISSWVPKTQIGKDVKSGKEKDIDNILENRRRILETEIVDSLIQLETDLINIGQAKGKFGGGKRRAWRQTQKKTKEGNVLSFSAMAVMGDRKGHIGLGLGKAKETLPSREKAIRKAKLNIFKIRRGFENPSDKFKEQYKNDPHTLPYVVEGKCGSIRIKLIPAPRGTGLVVGDECKKILNLAGIKDAYSFTKGNVRTAFNLAKACIDALNKTTEIKI
jgi:small subunit ribosomal protein S5